jgi:undecaprenyl diphosphate synthase
LTEDTGLPKHIAIIMDGNGRWAQKRGLPRVEGHRRGVVSVQKTVEFCAELGIEVLTLFAFSTENWNRPRFEVKFLMDTFLSTLFSERSRIMKNNIRFKLIGSREELDKKLITTAEKLENDSKDNDGMWLILAINYGGRSEIVSAVKNMISSGIKPEEITDETISNHLFTAGLPDPDMVIRTSGESRLSNFMIWQSAYSELIFVENCWPDFREDDLKNSIEIYKRRSRRFGGIK